MWIETTSRTISCKAEDLTKHRERSYEPSNSEKRPRATSIVCVIPVHNRSHVIRRLEKRTNSLNIQIFHFFFYTIRYHIITSNTFFLFFFPTKEMATLSQKEKYRIKISRALRKNETRYMTENVRTCTYVFW